LPKLKKCLIQRLQIAGVRCDDKCRKRGGGGEMAGEGRRDALIAGKKKEYQTERIVLDEARDWWIVAKGGKHEATRIK